MMEIENIEKKLDECKDTIDQLDIIAMDRPKLSKVCIAWKESLQKRRQSLLKQYQKTIKPNMVINK